MSKIYLSAEISRDNWKSIVIHAVESLPGSVRESFGYVDSGDQITVTAAVPDCDEDDANDGSQIVKLVVRYFATQLEQGWPKEYDELYVEGGPCHERISWPLVALETDRGESQGFYVGRADLESLHFRVQIEALEMLWSGGVISNDKFGRFVNGKGKPLLSHQEKN